MKTDPLIRAARKAYRATSLCVFDKLRAEESRWLRKRTIAENKLSDVRRRMNAFTMELAQNTVKSNLESDSAK